MSASPSSADRLAPWRDLRDALSGAQRVLLTGPTAPDGDSLGACLALQRVLATRGLQADVAGSPGRRYGFLSGASGMVPDRKITPSYDAVVVLDGDRHRLPPAVEAAFHAARVRGIIDHHASTALQGYTHAWVEGGATSTCEMLYEAFKADGVDLCPALGELLYVGSTFDTGGFRYSNTTPATHRMAARLLETGINHASLNARVLMGRRPSALRAAGQVFTDAAYHLDGQLILGEVSTAMAKRLSLESGDLEGIVDTLVYVYGVEVAALMNERSRGRVKISLRSRGDVNVAAIAKQIAPSGGGHAKAAGVCLDGHLEDARALLVSAVAQALSVSG